MVLRDTYINSMLRGAIILLLFFPFACQQSSDTSNSVTADSAAESARALEQEKSALGEKAGIVAQIATLRTEVAKVLGDMNGVFRNAEAIRAKGVSEKGASANENADAVFEKSASVLGALFILQGSVEAVERRYKENVLDDKSAQAMVDKLNMDVKSYQTDVENFKEMLRGGKPLK